MPTARYQLRGSSKRPTRSPVLTRAMWRRIANTVTTSDGTTVMRPSVVSSFEGDMSSMEVPFEALSCCAFCCAMSVLRQDAMRCAVGYAPTTCYAMCGTEAWRPHRRGGRAGDPSCSKLRCELDPRPSTLDPKPC
eukprot:586587-Rhodomonas_salina.1